MGRQLHDSLMPTWTRQARQSVPPMALSAFCFIALTSPAFCHGQSWSEVSNSGPSPRFLSGMTYDSSQGKVVLFGGGIGGNRFDDTWEWHGASWANVANGGPSPRMAAPLVYDSIRNVAVLYGGNAVNNSTNYSDTWELNGTSWTLESKSGPGPRCCHALAFDSNRGVTVFYGGSHLLDVFADTWEWDGTSWTEVAIAGPGPRYAPTMAYDTANQVVVLYGGSTDFFGTTNFTDTWTYDGTSWTQVATDGPPGRFIPQMVYDSDRGKMVLFGSATDSSGTTILNDTWEWDGSSWTEVTTNAPTPRYYHAMAYHEPTASTILFGGFDGVDYWGDTWKYGGVPPCAGADLDDDGDVDRDDYELFFQCVTGPGGGPVSPECQCADFDEDDDVDLVNFGSFQASFTGSPP